MSAEFELKGIKDLNKALKKLDHGVASKFSRAALRDGANVVKKEMVQSAPSRTGNLRKSIAVGTKKLGRTGFLAKIGPAKKTGRRLNNEGVRVKVVTADGWYAHMIEWGTKPHTIPKAWRKVRRKKVKASQVLKINGRVITGPITHPGTRKQPFLESSFRRKQREALRTIGRGLWKRINKVKATK